MKKLTLGPFRLDNGSDMPNVQKILGIILNNLNSAAWRLKELLEIMEKEEIDSFEIHNRKPILKDELIQLLKLCDDI